MEYYRLVLSDKVKNKLPLTGLDYPYRKVNLSDEEFDKLPNGIVTYYKYSPNIEITDILTEPTMMVSIKLRDILQMYNQEVRAKGVKVFPVEEDIDIAPEYYVINVPEIECISKEDVVINPNGTVQELILNRNDIGEEDVFRVKGTLENFTIVSLSVVESILRRKVYGVGFREVKVK